MAVQALKKSATRTLTVVNRSGKTHTGIKGAPKAANGKSNVAGKSLPHAGKMPVKRTRASPYPLHKAGVILPLSPELKKVQYLRPAVKEAQIAKLAHGLTRVLFSPGVTLFRDFRSKVYNFDPELKKIPECKDFDFRSLPAYNTSSKDPVLTQLASRSGVKYTGSTSSLTGVLSQFHFLVSEWRSPSDKAISHHWPSASVDFAPTQVMPASIKVNWKPESKCYAIDYDSTWTASEMSKAGNILMYMGTMLEKYLTKPIDQFKKHMKANSQQIPPEAKLDREAYSYAQIGSMLMRSQLDCVDSRLPGTGVFDIKTRATRSVRYDVYNYKAAAGYRLESLQGMDNSFEHEWKDLMRNAFLKYSLQARIGNMDGIFIAYHNTAELAGFQYVPLSQLDIIISGSEQRAQGNFNASVRLLQLVLDKATADFPEQDLLMTFETPTSVHRMNVWVQPKEWHSSSEPRPLRQYHISAESSSDTLTPSSSKTAPWAITYKINSSDNNSNATHIKSELALARQRQATFSDIKLSPDTGIDSFMADQQMFASWRDENDKLEAPSDSPESKSQIIIDKSDVNWRPVSSLRTGQDKSIKALRENALKGAKITADEASKASKPVQWKP